MTIALPVTTKSIQHYHFHYGKDEQGRGLSNNKNSHKFIPMSYARDGKDWTFMGAFNGKHNLLREDIVRSPWNKHRKHNIFFPIGVDPKTKQMFAMT